MRLLLVLGFITLTLAPAFAENDFASKLEGVYTTQQTDFVTMKRLTFTKEKDGRIRIQAALMGFPEEVSLGEATPELYTQRLSKTNPDSLLATFSSSKYKPFMILKPSTEKGIGGGSTIFQVMTYTCYFRDLDGKNVHISGTLHRNEGDK